MGMWQSVVDGEVQSIMFERSKWTPRRARQWLLRHGYVPVKVMHPTKRYFRYRLNDPDLYVSFRTIRLGDGVLGVYGSLT